MYLHRRTRIQQNSLTSTSQAMESTSEVKTESDQIIPSLPSSHLSSLRVKLIPLKTSLADSLSETLSIDRLALPPSTSNSQLLLQEIPPTNPNNSLPQTILHCPSWQQQWLILQDFFNFHSINSIEIILPKKEESISYKFHSCFIVTRSHSHQH